MKKHIKTNILSREEDGIGLNTFTHNSRLIKECRREEEMER